MVYSNCIKKSLLPIGITLFTTLSYATEDTYSNNLHPSSREKYLERFSFDTSYLLWWFKTGPAPLPVVTEGPISTIYSGFEPGTLGAPGTVIVMGNKPLATPVHQGGRFNLEYWLSDEHSKALEGSYFFLDKQKHTETISLALNPNNAFLSNQNTLNAPFYDSTFLKQTVYNIAGTENSGSATLSNYSSLQGADFHLIQNIISSEQRQLSWLAGFYFLQVKEGLSFATDSVVVINSEVAAAGSFVNTLDKFTTQNNFYGGQIGLKFNYNIKRLFLQSMVKVALGDVQEKLSIKGSTTTNSTDSTLTGLQTLIPTTTIPGGIYAEPTNMGKQVHQHFACIPEITLGAGFYISKNINAFINYNFLYLSNLVRPGNQMDGRININQFTALYGGIEVPPITFTGPVTPAPFFNTSTFWAQGIQFGLRYQIG